VRVCLCVEEVMYVEVRRKRRREWENSKLPISLSLEEKKNSLSLTFLPDVEHNLDVVAREPGASAVLVWRLKRGGIGFFGVVAGKRKREEDEDEDEEGN